MKLRTRLMKMLILGFKQMQDPYYQGFAAQIAFYLLLSIVPILLLITQLLGVFDISVSVALERIEQYTGEQVSSVIQSIFAFSSAGYGNLIYVVIALWAGSRASFSIMRITNYTMTGGQNTGKGYWPERIRAIKTMIITILTVVFSIIILVYGELILETILSVLDIRPTGIFNTLWVWLRWVAGFLLFFLMISYNYYILPTEKLKYRQIIPGSIFASAGMLIVTIFYSKYANSLADYDLIYGTLSSVVAILFWFYLLSWVLCLGVMCNKVWEDTGRGGGSAGYHPYWNE